MRYSYGIMDRKKIILYKPQLFLKTNDILAFPSKDFKIWHGSIREYIDSLYQINTRKKEKDKSINITELKLALGVINNLTEELENLFNSEITTDFSYQYISRFDKKYKLRKSPYSNDMRRCDIQIPVKPEITPWLKQQHQIEIIKYAERQFERASIERRTCR